MRCACGSGSDEGGGDGESGDRQWLAGRADEVAVAEGFTDVGDVGLYLAPAENCVRAVQAACWYSWMMPPSRSLRRMSR